MRAHFRGGRAVKEADEVIKLHVEGLLRTEVPRCTRIGVASVYRALADAKKHRSVRKARAPWEEALSELVHATRSIVIPLAPTCPPG